MEGLVWTPWQHGKVGACLGVVGAPGRGCSLVGSLLGEVPVQLLSAHPQVQQDRRMDLTLTPEQNFVLCVPLLGPYGSTVERDEA